MPKFFVDKNQIRNNKVEIIGTDVNHIKNVLRASVGEKLEICDSSTKQDYLCEIENITKENIMCNIIEKLKTNVESDIQITVFQGLPKADKMELIIQKSVELGGYDIIPVEMKRSIVKLKENDKTKKLLRWQKISEVAAKQCGRNIIPEIKPIINVKNICNFIPEYDIVLVAYEKEEKNKLKEAIQLLERKKEDNKILKIAVVIGPEGGIDEQEIHLLEGSGAQIVTLGKRILRTETVALNMLSILMYELED